MIALIDRYVGAQVVVRWILALAIGTGLLLAAELMGRITALPALIDQAGWGPLLHYYVLRVPTIVALWLPGAPLVAAMLTISPLHRLGQLTALGAAGISPRRACRAMLMIALFSGVMAWIMADRLLPALAARLDASEFQLNNGGKNSGERARTAGWRVADQMWHAESGYPSLGRFREVTISRPSADLMVMAKELVWTTDGWELREVRLITGASVRSTKAARPSAIGLGIPPDRDDLAITLRPISDVPGPDLPLDQRVGQSAVAKRIALALLPWLILGWSIPFFMSRLTSQHLGMATARALLMAVVPVIAIALFDRVLLSSKIAVPLLSAVVMIPLSAYAGWAWWRMRI